jgi:hypothetical protein
MEQPRIGTCQNPTRQCGAANVPVRKSRPIAASGSEMEAGVGGRYDLCEPCWDDLEHCAAKYGLGGPEPFRPEQN